MNLRQSITRNITYTKVTVLTQGEEKNYTVYGETTPAKELKKMLKNDMTEIPSITVETKTEQRAISLEDFIKYSEVINENQINESEDNK